MFKNDLKRRLRAIFDFDKVSFNVPDYSGALEQDTLFVEITGAPSSVTTQRGGRQTARVVGQLVVFSQGETSSKGDVQRFPFGFMTKRIAQARREFAASLFFYDVDIDIPSSPARLQNLFERRTSFVFLYDSQYDPEQGELTSIDFLEV